MNYVLRTPYSGTFLVFVDFSASLYLLISATLLGFGSIAVYLVLLGGKTCVIRTCCIRYCVHTLDIRWI